MQRMRESKLQKKTIKLVLQIYLSVLLIYLVLSYFLVISPLMKSAIEGYKSQNDYILEEADSLLNSIKEYTNYIAYSENLIPHINAYLKNPEDKVVRFNLETYLYNAKNLKMGIQDVVLDVEGQDMVNSILDLKEEEQNVLESEWYQKIKSKSYSGAFSKGIAITQNDVKVKLIAYSKRYYMKNRRFTLTVFFRYDDIFGNLMRYYRSDFQEQYWISVDGSALFESEENNLQALKEKFGDETGYLLKNSRGVLFCESLGNSSWRSVSYVPMKDIMGKIFETYLIIFSMAIGLLIGTLFIVVYVVKRVTSPVHRLAEAMQAVVDENFATQVLVESDDEIGYLSQTFNHMSLELQSYFKQIVEKVQAEQKMKFGLLISQIDPHFFCNTLNTIKYLAKQDRTKDVEVVSAALSNILRDRLRIKDFQIYDTVEQEMQTTRQYLTIQEYRYGEKVEVEWLADDTVRNILIPKNIIQPLVENALLHGLTDEEDGSIKGKITVLVEVTDCLHIVITDDGCGMTPEKISSLLSRTNKTTAKGHGIGIDNIRERLELLYGDQAEMRIESEPGKWTKMEIVFQKWEKC